MVTTGDVIVVAVDSKNPFSIMGRLSRFNETTDLVLTGLTREERKREDERKDRLTFSKIGYLDVLDEGVEMIISNERIIFIATGSRNVPSQ